MQWDDGENAGFSKGKPWLRINKNYKYINYASQKKDPLSVLNFYKALISMRKKSECLVYGEFLPIYADNRIMIYQRKLAETYTIVLNFSSHVVKPPKKFASLFSQPPVICATGEKWNGTLLPWEGVLFKNQ
jgi:glycosidase